MDEIQEDYKELISAVLEIKLGLECGSIITMGEECKNAEKSDIKGCYEHHYMPIQEKLVNKSKDLEQI